MIEARESYSQPQTSQSRSLRLSRSNLLVALLLCFALLLGAYFRFTGNNWDDFVRWHPDERYLTMSVAPNLGNDLFLPKAFCEVDANGFSSNCDPGELRYYLRYQECLARHPQTNGLGGYFDTDCSPFNPENIIPTNYSYGTLPLFMARAAGEIWSDLDDTSVYIEASGIQLVWRALSAMADTIVIGLVFLIGLRLHGKWVGVLAALLYSAAVLPIQLAHFGTTDAMTNMFVALALFFAVRTQDSGSYWDYGAFGLALGAAVSSRINVAYLAGIIPLVAILRTLPALDSSLPADERARLVLRGALGVLIAALASLLVFRLFNPYAFSATGIIPTGIDDRFLETLSQSRRNVSGEAESPPNWQWVNRTPYLFAFQNMVLWGMGIALGAAGWLGWLWTGWRLIFARVGGVRNLVLFAWVGVYFALTGGLWVMTMRYYLPMYPALTVLAAWGLVEAVKLARERATGGRTTGEHAKGRAGLIWRWLATASLVGVTAFTLLWGLMFTNIYRNMATFTQASHWVMEQVPGDFFTRMDGADPSDPLINIGFWNNLAVPRNTPTERYLLEAASRLNPNTPSSGGFIAPEDGTISRITAHRLVGATTTVDPQTGQSYTVHDSGDRTIQITLTRGADNTPLARAAMTGSFPPGEHVLGQSYEFVFDEPVQLEAGQQYFLNATVEGGLMLVSGAVLANEQPWDEPFPANVCTLPPGVTLADDPPSGLRGIMDCNGRSSWHNLVHAISMDIVQEDIEDKRARWQIQFDEYDYIAIQTNRRYDSQSRIPARWPLTNRYYEALFSGELGFELVQTFQETFELGPLKISDQYLPTYDGPAWLNEFEAEEAFSVYDHPVVFIFKKTEDYDSARMRAILDSVELARAGTVAGGYNNPIIAELMPLLSLEADEAPTHLQLTPDMQETQTQGGTWSERFDRDNWLNSNQVLLVIVWWLLMLGFGWIVWPLLFLAFPALADRGYGFAKFLGMLLVAWIAWVLATLRIHAWSPDGLLLIFAAVGLMSALLAWRKRAALRVYVRERWRLLLTIELLFALLYLFMIGVRLMNPDLWHNYYGGEKPMDFAYFNAILRSTVFPPMDPWFAGGYINYYYFGFVIVGAPTLMLGVVPAIAYNLILPTLFASTGLAAFSAAFNITNGWWRREVSEVEPEAEGQEAERRAERRTVGSPWVAGLMALALAVLLGNLATPGVFVNHVAAVGGYDRAQGLYEFYLEQKIEDYTIENDSIPDEVARLDLEAEARQQAAEAGFFDRVSHELRKMGALISGFVSGFGDVIGGTASGVRSSNWFWSPTRVIAEIPNQFDGAINEMPYFTYLYGDMHAHMIAMPMMLIAVAFVFNELMTAGRDRRGRFGRALALALGALVVGLFQATNTWDFPTFMILSLAGLAYAWWLRWTPHAVMSEDLFDGLALRLSRWSVLDFVRRIGAFVLLALIAALPYTYWFASALTEFKVWEGKKTPLWAYLTIHGLFIFLIVALLLWETVRWLRSARVADLQGKLRWVLLFMLAIMALVLAALVLAAADYQAALVVIPLVIWIALLFFRPGQSRSMQYVLVLAGLALCITLGTEFVTLSNDNGRQNTIFKFYMQVWLIFSVVGGVAFAWLIRDSFRWTMRAAVPFYLVFGLLFFAAALYPLVATRAKAEYRLAPETPLTLDGNAYMQYAQHWEGGLPSGRWMDLDADYRVIRWLQENVEGSPVIMEGLGSPPLYNWTSRISINTGLPSVIGWDYHQRQQRSLRLMSNLVEMRVANVNAFYTTPDIAAAAEILRHYDVEYVIVSVYERLRYASYDPVSGELLDNTALEKFDRMVERGMLEIAWQDDEATIYRVNQEAIFDQMRAMFETADAAPVVVAAPAE